MLLLVAIAAGTVLAVSLTAFDLLQAGVPRGLMLMLHLSLLAVMGLALWYGRRVRVAAMASSHRVLAVLASTDELTGLANRRAFLAAAEREVSRSLRYGRRCALLVWDLNGLKTLNDRGGHPAGDEALRRFAGAIEAAARVSDTTARIGGDEFAALLPEGTREGAEAFQQRVEDSLRALTSGTVTAAFGAAVFPDDGESLEEVYALADRRMYEDKARASAR